MLSQNSKFFYLLLLSGLVIIFSFSYNIYKEIKGSRTCDNSNNIIEGLGGPINLIDQNEMSFSLIKQDAAFSLLYFGYSFCPDICPYDLERNAYVKDIMDEEQLDLNLIFITLDQIWLTIRTDRIYLITLLFLILSIKRAKSYLFLIEERHLIKL